MPHIEGELKKQEMIEALGREMGVARVMALSEYDGAPIRKEVWACWRPINTRVPFFFFFFFVGGGSFALSDGKRPLLNHPRSHSPQLMKYACPQTCSSRSITLMQ